MKSTPSSNRSCSLSLDCNEKGKTVFFDGVVFSPDGAGIFKLNEQFLMVRNFYTIGLTN
jgi:hypothetical protein